MGGSKYEYLLKPIKIGGTLIKNRFVMPPMLSEKGNGTHHFTDEAVAYYVRRAKGGFGLLITEFMCVSPEGLGCREEMGIWSDVFIPDLVKLTKAVQKEGAKIFAQLHHQGALASEHDIHQRAVGASAIPAPGKMEKVRALSVEEVYEVIGKFKEAAIRAKSAGFDGVEIHAAHSYLLCQFLSPYFNKRADEFGGSYENSFRICEYIIKEIKKSCGHDFPVSIRVSTEEFADAGLTAHDLRINCVLAERAGADCIHVSTGGIGGNVVTPYFIKAGFNIENIRKVKECVDIPVIGVGRMNDAVMMDLYISGGFLDMVSLGRQSVCDPDFPVKIMQEKENEIIPCIACLQRCFFTPGYDKNDTGISCMLNPFSGKETAWVIKEAKKKKEIAIVGAGPAGLEAAWILAARGHHVEVFEKENTVGGAFRLAAVPPHKQDFGKVIHTYKILCEKYGAKIKLGFQADCDFLSMDVWDDFIIATGSRPFIPPIQGLEQEPYVLAADILDGKRIFSDKRVLIIGGGLVGCETAEFLSMYGNQVVIAEMKDSVAEECSPVPKTFLMESMKKKKIEMYTSAKVEKIEKGNIKAEIKGKLTEFTEFDRIVIAAGSRPSAALADELREKGKRVHVIGDAKKVRDARAAIYEGAFIGMSL